MPTAVVSQITIDPKIEGVYQKLTGKVVGKIERHRHRVSTAKVGAAMSHQTEPP
jgi:hypothetical protein